MTTINVDHEAIYGDWGYSKDFSIDPQRTALLIIDMQSGFLFSDGGNYIEAYSNALPVDLSYQADRVRTVSLPTIQRLLSFFRETDIPVVHVWTASETKDFGDMPPAKARWLRKLEDISGMDIYKSWQPEVQIMPEVAPLEHEMVILKKTGSAFNQTGLHFGLQNMGIETLVIVGGNTNGCVFETSVYAAELGYFNILVSDATHCFHPDLQVMAEEIFRVQYGMVWNSDDLIEKLKVLVGAAAG